MHILKKNTRKGFTLIELLVVISIIALLSSIVLAAVSHARDSAQLKSGLEFNTYNYHFLGVTGIANYDFNEASGNPIDHSGNNFNLVLTGCTSSPFCRSNNNTPTGTNVLNLNGSSQYGTVYPLPSTPPAITQFTASAWINLNNIPPSYYPILSVQSGGSYTNGGSDFNRTIYIDYRPAGIFLQYNNCKSNAGGAGTAVGITPGTWVQITYVMNATGAVTFYINGHSVSAITMAGTCTGESAVPTAITVGTLAGADFFNGAIDDVNIYTQALSDAQVYEKYAESAPAHKLAVK